MEQLYIGLIFGVMIGIAVGAAITAQWATSRISLETTKIKQEVLEKFLAYEAADLNVKVLEYERERRKRANG